MLYGCSFFRHTFVRPSLLGALDGLITSFVIVAGGVASGASRAHILRIGVASLVADGLSMGVSELISSRAQDELTLPQAGGLGLVCFVSFLALGGCPLVAFAVGPSVEVSSVLSILAFSTLLLAIGGLRACMTRENALRAVLETVLIGGIAGGCAYGIASIR